MKLEQQVTSLEISKRLKELGVKQDGFFRYVENIKIEIEDNCRCCEGRPDISVERNGWIIEPSTGEVIYPTQSYSAFTVAELGEMLPTDQHSNSFKTKNGDWVMYYAPEGGEVGYTKVYGGTEADARGKMLIYLLENKLITL